MTDKIIEIGAARDRRTCAEIAADEAHWERVCDRLIQVMSDSKLSDTALISTTLSALLDTLHPIDIDDAKKRIAQSLACFC